jgi:hypothetical protein
MKHNYKHSIIQCLTFLTVALLACGSITAQPGYNPWMRMPPRRPIPVPYRPVQSYRPENNQNMNQDRSLPFISFGLHFDPLLSWFSTDSYHTRNEGVVPGFNFGISYNRNFSPNYSFSSGINIINAGGRLVQDRTSNIDLYNFGSVTVPAEEAITYKITYLSVPLGLKLRTSQLGYGRFFADVGVDPKLMIAARADIPSLEIKGGNASPEFNSFNLSFHVMGGMEYPLGEYNSLILGLGFDKNLFDSSVGNGSLMPAVVIQKTLSFRIGMTF